MRELAGTVGFHLVFVVAGLALLYALGFVRRLRDVPAAIGPAYLAGVAGVMTLLLAGLSAGATVRLPALVVVAAIATVVLGALGFRAARRARAASPDEVPARATRLEAWVARAVIAVLAAFFVIGASAFANAPTVGDDWTIWSYKGLALFHFGSVDDVLWTASDLGPAHPYYPPLQPLFQSLFFRSVGDIQFQEFHTVLWFLFGSFIWTVVWLARSRGLPLLIALVPAAALAFTSKSHEIVEIGYVDMTVSAFAAAGALCVGLWLHSGAGRYAILGAVFMTGAANSKNEGVAAVAAILVASGAVMWFQRRDAWRQWAVMAAIAVAGALPWMLWRSSKGIEDANRADADRVLDTLGPEIDRVPKSFTAIFDQIADGGRWAYLVPCLLVLAVVCLVRGTARREAAFYLAVPVLMTFTLVFVYWTGTLEIDYWLGSSADRTVAGIAYVSGVGLVHLTALLLSGAGAAARDGSRRPERGPP
jgi:hypothetical protein